MDAQSALIWKSTNTCESVCSTITSLPGGATTVIIVAHCVKWLVYVVQTVLKTAHGYLGTNRSDVDEPLLALKHVNSTLVFEQLHMSDQLV